jgi:hypothetical protein
MPRLWWTIGDLAGRVTPLEIQPGPCGLSKAQLHIRGYLPLYSGVHTRSVEKY